ncbi:MAG: ATP-binding protein [Gammaproteobacteria bacterium]|nr:ATP-binding protein [Gammaproteobacteria bacterium]
MPLVPENWLQQEPVSEHELLNIIGCPEGSTPEQDGALQLLELSEIGPASCFRYKPAARLNIITGDNSLGKTFLFDCIWQALTGEWIEDPIRPRANVSKNTPCISFSVAGAGSRQFKSGYDWNKQQWAAPKNRAAEAGVVIYARFDGSFAVWDSTRGDFEGKVPTQLVFTHDALWNGLSAPDGKGWLCNGLIRDWVSWQLSGARYKNRWQALLACLNSLSPSGEPMRPGDPVRISITDEREMPALYMPYGLVPLVNASAGVQRAVALAYVLVWTWFRHVDNSELLRREPANRVVLIVDEVEAHLHPRWQRVIIPALMAAAKELCSSLSPQIHVATHSPMVMASAEVVFDEEKDGFHHLRLNGNEVVLEEIPFVKRGCADLWLMSEAFGLAMPRSLPGEEAINDAKKLQLSEEPSLQQVKAVHKRLMRFLAQDDDFWPRWRFFAKQHGI